MPGILAGESFQFRVVICGKLDNVRWESLQCFQKLSCPILTNKYICSGSVQSSAVLVRKYCGREASHSLFVERRIFFSDSWRERGRFSLIVMRACIEPYEKGIALTRNCGCCPQDFAKFSTYQNSCFCQGKKESLAEIPSPI